MKRYFVTGATGFLGGRLVEELLHHGHEVRALVRNPSSEPRLKAKGVRVFRGDVRDASSLVHPMTDCDGVFHTAAWVRVGEHGPDAHAINVEGTRTVLDTAISLHVPKIVYTSTIAVFGDTRSVLADERYTGASSPRTRYEQTKAKAHFDVVLPRMAQGAPIVVTMPGLLYGPGDRGPMASVLEQFLRGRLPVVPRDAYFSWSFIDDVALSHVAAMERGRIGETYILAGPRHGMAEVLDLAGSLTGIPAPRIRPGARTLKLAARIAAWLERFLPLAPSWRAESLRAVAGVSMTGSSHKARAELGFEPRALDEGLPLALSAALQRVGPVATLAPL